LPHADIRSNIERILNELPSGVELVAAAKSAPPQSVLEAVRAGVKIIGENYVQEAEEHRRLVGGTACWHFIGRLQKNKAKKAAALFDMIETVDSVDIAREIDRHSAEIGKVMPVLIEINSGLEEQKAGVLPEDAAAVVGEIAGLGHVRVMGLMTMGPRFGEPEEFRPYFAEMKRVFDIIKGRGMHGVEMRYLSMGMTNSYRVAIEEGANIVRIGSAIFGQRLG
jgi:pyridoxal phosphate enzyme (YggS family)